MQASYSYLYTKSMTMVITSHKLRQWAILILITALFLDIEGATTSCYLGEELDTNASKSIIIKEGYYLLKDAPIPCDGRIASIELCGVSISSDLTQVYLNASIYRPHLTNSLERITELVRLESGSSNIVINDEVTCARLSAVDYNWTVLKGDILGVSFVNSSCDPEERTFGTLQTCPVYAAIQTNSTSDMVYSSENNSLTTIQFDKLSNITGVKISLQVFVEPLPPLFSDICDSEIASDPLRSKKVITDPSEQQIFTGSGTYIMNERVECSRYVTSIYFCGGLVDEHEPWPQPKVYRFALLHLRLSGNRYNIIDREIVDYKNVTNDETSTFNPTCHSSEISGWYVLQGDQFGVILYAHCGRNSCPIQIGLINTGCIDTSLFVTDSGDNSYYYSRGSISKNNTSLVAIKLNFEIHYDDTSPDECLDQSPLYLRIIYAISVTFVAIIALLVVLSVVLMVRLKRTKPQVYDVIKRGVRQGSTRLRNTLSRRSSGTIHGIHNRSYSEQNEYSNNYNHVLNARVDIPQSASVNLWTRHQASLLNGSYEEPVDAIDRYERCDTEEDLYIDPPSKEMDLKEQLQKVEVLKENIQLKEYLGSGRFGVVYRGLLTVSGDDSEGGIKEVAVKTMENGASEEVRVKFLQEAAIMEQFNNPYILKIYGALIASQPYMIICELMNKGDLRCYLNSVKISGSQDADEIAVMLLKFSRQVASAMLYLSGKGFVHRDLAARNILVSMDRICKVSDFGLSRDLQDDDYYVAHGGLIPVRWTAPEALKQRKYSIASDVWSYGVVLFEIWSLASRPYGTLTNEQVLRQVFAGYRLPSPAGCPRAVYDLMISCWHPETVQRPTFAQLHASLQRPDNVLMEWSEDEQVKYSENARTIGAMFQDGEVLHNTLQRAYLVLETQK